MAYVFRKQILFFLVLLLFSCTKELDITLPYEGDKMVVECYLSPQKNLSLQITSTIAPTGKDLVFKKISHAIVQLYEEGDLVTTPTHEGNGFYSSNFKPTSGKKYQLKIKAQGYPDVESSQETIPEKPLIPPFIFSGTYTTINKNPAQKLSFSLADVLNQKNYYMMYVTGYYLGEKVGIGAENMNSSSEIKSTCIINPNQYNTFYASDACFDNKSLLINFLVETHNTLQGNYPIGTKVPYVACETIILGLRNISESYYLYHITAFNQPLFYWLFTHPINNIPTSKEAMESWLLTMRVRLTF